MVVHDLDGRDGFAEAQAHSHVAEAELEIFGQFVIDEFQEPGAALDEGDAHADGGQHAGVFGADDAAADDDHAARQLAEQEQVVAVDDFVGREGDFLGAGGHGSDGDEDIFGAHVEDLLAAGDAQRVGIEERRAAEEHGDSVAAHLAADDIDFGSDYVVGAVKQVGHVDVVLDGVAGAVERALLDAGEMQDGFADGLGGDGSGVNADAADAVGAFDDGDGFAEFSGVEGGLLAGRARSNHHQIVFCLGHRGVPF